MSWLGRLFGQKEARPSGPKRPRFTFAGAQMGRLTADWLMSWMSGKNELRWELRTLRLRSRELVRNTPIAQRYIGLCDENILGHEGIQLQMRAMTAQGEPDEETNAQIEAAWAEWGQRGNCTLDGRYSWRDFEGASLEQTVRDGEGLIEMVEGADNPYGFALQLIDPDQLSEEKNAFGNNAPTIVMGVEVDRYNKPVKYHLLSQHPQEYGGNRQPLEIPASRILHIGRSTRVGQVRYQPWLTPVLLELKMLAEYELSALVSERVSAGKMGFIIPAADDQGPDPEASAEDQEQSFEVEPGMFKRLAPGETIADFDPKGVADRFDGFVKAKLRSIAAGLHVSYASLTGDYTQVNYSSGRLASLAERDRWRVLQCWYAQSLHQRVFAKWLPWAVLRRKVRLPGPVQDYISAATWEYRGWPWVDPEKDANALAKECSMGLNDLITAAAEKGRDFEQIVKSQARALKIAKKYDVPITLDAKASAPEPAVPEDSAPPPTKKPQEAAA